MYKAKDVNTGKLVALKKTRLEVMTVARRFGFPATLRGCICHFDTSGRVDTVAGSPNAWSTGGLAMLQLLCMLQMEEEGVPSTTLREISLLQMLSESNHIVKCVRLAPSYILPCRMTLSLGTHPPGGCRLLAVEHTEENGKPCLYLVGAAVFGKEGRESRSPRSLAPACRSSST